METKEFGARLKELRKQAGLNQRELAAKVGVNFSYLSKIENGAMPPPSEQVILRLAEVLDADKDELMILAGKIPSDIAQILKNQKALQLLRSDRTLKKIREVSRNNKKERFSTVKKLTSYKSLSRIAVPIMLVCAVAASLWFVSPLPARALEIDILNSQGGTTLTSGTLGSEYHFQVKVSIEDNELLPIKTINLKIYYEANSSTYYDEYTNLPLGSQDYTSTSGTAATASIKATPDSMWGYFTTGTGYAYWKGTGYTFAPIVGGYGYQTGPLAGTTAITYDINWTPPSSGWPTGAYKIEAKITAQDDKTFTQTSSSFTLSAAEVDDGVGVGVGAPTPKVVTVSPGVFDVSDVVTWAGKFRVDVTIDSEDGNVELDINEDTIGKTKENEPLSEISILEMAEPPAPPADADVVGLTYDLGPDEATFDPPITLTFTYDPDEGVDEEDLVIALWDEDVGEWVELEDCTFDPVTHTITAPVSHFTPFAILGAIPIEEEEAVPAAFTISNISISPAEVNTGESVSISVQIANTGDLSGSYDVTLKVNNTVVETKSITLEGGSSQTVSFTTAQDIAGTYTVNIEDLSGTFTVKAVPELAAFTASGLSISPAEVNTGESISISVRIANTGDLSGSYDVTLKINGAVVETKSVTLAGGSSQTVSFTTTQDVAGTYTVNIKDLSGTFTVKAAPAGIAWWVWVIVGVAVVIGGLLAYFLWWRRRY